MKKGKLKRICFLIPNNVAGGAERVMTSLANEISKRGIQSFFMTFDSNSSFYPLDKSVNVVRLNEGTDEYSKVGKKIRLPFIEIKRYYKMKKALKRISPDCVVSFMFMANVIGWLCCRKLHIPIILSERNDPSKYSSFKRKVMKYVYSRVNGFVCQSSKMKKYAEETYLLNNVIVIPNPISENQVTNYSGNKTKKIISMGRLIPQKNHLMLIEAFSKLPDKFNDYSLHIYGDGPLKKDLQKAIDELSLNKRVFLKGIEKDAIKKNADATLFVLSSNFEGFPNVLVEAMANGILSISSDFPSGSARDIIENKKNGFLFEVGNDNQLLELMTYCLDNYQNLKDVELNAKKIYNKIKLSHITDKWINYINSIL